MGDFADPQYTQDVNQYSSAVAQQLGTQAGLLAVAQANVETGNGQHFSTLYNFANIGNTDSNPSGGGVYASPTAAANAYVAFLRNNPRYSKYLTDAKNGADASVLALDLANAGWATDPNYGSKLIGALGALGHQGVTVPAPIATALGSVNNAAAGVNSPSGSGGSVLSFGSGLAYYGITAGLVVLGLVLLIVGFVLVAKS